METLEGNAGLEEKEAALRAILAGLGRVLVAYSGGVDSTLLLKVACQALGPDVLAVIATSVTYPQRELHEALRMAQEMGARVRVVESQEIEVAGFTNNPPNRCYFCKSELYAKLREVADQEGFPFILDGTNLDDERSGDRPGMRAAQERGVRSPLREAGFSKDEVRRLSRKLGLSTWDKPAFACLSSRFPFGERITPEKLRMVEEAEDFLHSLGFRQYRLRHHGTVARIEIPPSDFPLLLRPETAAQVIEKLKKVGFVYVTLDLQGYRYGSMNDALTAQGLTPSEPHDGAVAWQSFPSSAHT